MTYCPRCGKQNPDDAIYCNNCGANLSTGTTHYRRRDEDRCNEECAGRGKTGLVLWGVIVILVGVGIILSAIANFWTGAPEWLKNFQWWWIIVVIIGAFIIAAGARMLARSGRNQ